jgi:hypothetical protein
MPVASLAPLAERAGAYPRNRRGRRPSFVAIAVAKAPQAGRRAVLIALVVPTAGLSGLVGGSSTSTATTPVSPSSTTVTLGICTIQVEASDGTTTEKMPLTLVVM